MHRGHLNIKISSYQYRDSHYKDKTWKSPYLERCLFIERWGPVVNKVIKTILNAFISLFAHIFQCCVIGCGAIISTLQGLCFIPNWKMCFTPFTQMGWVMEVCGCLVTWFCYQLIAKPGNKTATPPWPRPKYFFLKDIYTPRNEVSGGILDSACLFVCPSVCLSVNFFVSAL